ncbi:hypothetical protein HDU79_001217 [Rhizoclosmatium sp. JEL0117]|nr:hypothetical protein HDU79_001217 [Rhizoclosmatium sp. JEL0117]
MESKLISPAAARNTPPILKALEPLVQSLETSQKGPLRALEVASGPGQHLIAFAQTFPNVTWTPSEVNKENIASIEQYRKESRLTNIEPALLIDASSSRAEWKISDASMDLIVNVNMVHISPWSASQGLFTASGNILRPNGLLVLYGPFMFNGVISPQSNLDFDASLKSRNKDWGLRDVKDLTQFAEQSGLQLIQTLELPSNNHILVYQKK